MPATKCIKRTAKRYTSRNSPPFSAMDCKRKMKKGKDGMYRSKPDKNNVYKWVKVVKNTLKKR